MNDDMVGLKFIWLALEPLWAESFAIYEGVIEALNILNEDLHQRMSNNIKYKCSIVMHLHILLPKLSILPTQDI